EPADVAGLRISGQYSDDPPVAGMFYAFRRPMRQDLAPKRPYSSRDFFPHLTRSELRIQKLFDQRCFHILLGNILLPSGNQFFQYVGDRLINRETLNALSPPFGADFLAFDTPHLFRVRLEKREIQLASEAVDKKLLEVFFVADGK